MLRTRSTVAVVTGIILVIPEAAWSQDLRKEDFYNMHVKASVTVEHHGREGGKTFRTPIHHEWESSFDPVDAITGNRWSTYRPRGRASKKEIIFIRGRLDYPAQHNQGYHIWLVNSNTLVNITTTEVGAFTTTFFFTRKAGGWACNTQVALAKELGKGSNRVVSAVTGMTAELVAIKQLSSACMVTPR